MNNFSTEWKIEKYTKPLKFYVFMSMRVLLFIISFIPVLFQDVQLKKINHAVDAEICLSANEKELAHLINSYREKHNLKPVKISKSLTLVAQLHVHDLVSNKPYDEKGKCNPHSWSDQGKWKACCYSSGSNGECMWNKPEELTSYKSEGYEIVMAQFNSEFPIKEVTAHEALEAWKDSRNHNDIILNKNIWKAMEWNAMGVGIYQGFAAVWFGIKTDSEGIPEFCSE